MVTFSIIIPVFNSEQYIERCLLSIKNQTFSNFECLIIDDGSEDDSLKIINKICNEDSRFIIFHQENKGVSSARNLGLKHLHGRYTIFIDSDDYVESNFLELVNQKNKNSSLIFFTQELKEGEINSRELIDKLHSLTMPGSPWGKIFKTEIIKKNNIIFPIEIDFCEDLVFLLKYLFCIEKLSVRNEKIYNYTVRENSLCHKISAKRYKQHLIYFINFAKTNIENQIFLKEICISKYLWIFNNYNFFTLLSFSKFHKEIGSFYNDVSKTDSKTKLRNRFGRQALSLIKFSFFIYLLFMKLKIFINTRKL